jgi:plastocyanin
VWLQPHAPAEAPTIAPGHFTLLQRDRTFVPHLLVIPAGSIVSFPNADPFFHNVFSLFNGKRFDLGLYEAGASREVLFSRVGVSYIFCNIHSEMSAVVIAITTPLFAIAGADARATVRNIPSGDYDLHVWVEGVSDSTLNSLTRRVHIRPANADAVTVELHESPSPQHDHLNEFGQPYDRSTHQPY